MPYPTISCDVSEVKLVLYEKFDKLSEMGLF